MGFVVQARSFWKNLRKGYTRIQKSYFLVTRSGKKIKTTELVSSTCAKRARIPVCLANLLITTLGKRLLPANVAPPSLRGPVTGC